MKAQEALTAATIKADRLNNFRPNTVQAKQSVVQTDSEPAKAPASGPVDTKAQAWRDANTWFGTDDEMTALALAVHRKLVQSNVSPTSDEYYEKINSRIREVFPTAFSDASTSEATEKKPTKSTTVVAPATRSTAPRKIVLTQSQVNIAKRLGVPLELYAKQVAKEQRNNNG